MKGVEIWPSHWIENESIVSVWAVQPEAAKGSIFRQCDWMEGEGDLGEMDVWAQAKWNVFLCDSRKKKCILFCTLFDLKGVIKHAVASRYTFKYKRMNEISSCYHCVIPFTATRESHNFNILSSMQDIKFFFNRHNIDVRCSIIYRP